MVRPECDLRAEAQAKFKNECNYVSEIREVWHLHFYGPRQCVHLKDFPNAKKVLIEFHGEPELVAMHEVFNTASECYQIAASKKMLEGMACIEQASKWLAESVGKVPNP